MANPCKMLEIFIIFCYFIHYSHSTALQAYQQCLLEMIDSNLVREIEHRGSKSTYENKNFPIPESMLNAFNRSALREPINTYIKNYSVKKASTGNQESPLVFCKRLYDEKKAVEECLHLMIFNELITEKENRGMESTYINKNFPIPESMLNAFSKDVLKEPFKTYINDYFKKPKLETPLAFCQRQGKGKNECLIEMIDSNLVREIEHRGSKSTYENKNFPIPESMLNAFKRDALREPFKTYMKDYLTNLSKLESPLAFCQRQGIVIKDKSSSGCFKGVC